MFSASFQRWPLYCPHTVANTGSPCPQHPAPSHQTSSCQIFPLSMRKTSEMFVLLCNTFIGLHDGLYIALEIMRRSMFSFENSWCIVGQLVLDYTRVYLAVTAHLQLTWCRCTTRLGFGCGVMPLLFPPFLTVPNERNVSCYVDSLLRGNGSIAKEAFWNQILSVMLWRHPTSLKDSRDQCAKTSDGGKEWITWGTRGSR